LEEIQKREINVKSNQNSGANLLNEQAENGVAGKQDILTDDGLKKDIKSSNGIKLQNTEREKFNNQHSIINDKSIYQR